MKINQIQQLTFLTSIRQLRKQRCWLILSTNEVYASGFSRNSAFILNGLSIYPKLIRPVSSPPSPAPKRPFGSQANTTRLRGPPHRFTKIDVMSFPWRHSYWQLLAWHWRSFRTSFYRNSSRPPHVSVINRLRTPPLTATAVHSVELCSNTHFTSSG